MCLFIKHQNPNKLPFVNGRITAYKILVITGRDQNSKKAGTGLESLYMGGYEYLPGFNVAEDGFGLTIYNKYKVVDNGAIHVCLSVNSTKGHTRRGESIVVVPVTCYKKDFIAVGDYAEACFTKVFLSKENYKKALKAKTKYELVKGK